MLLEETDRRLIDGWQRDFPITPAPFAEIAAALGIAESDVLARLDEPLPSSVQCQHRLLSLRLVRHKPH